MDTSHLAGLFDGRPQLTLRRGEILIQPGGVPPNVYLIESGTVAQYDITPSGDKVTLNVFKPGAYFPMSYAMTGATNDFFFEVSSATAVVHQAPARAAAKLLRDHPELAYDLLVRVYRGTNGLTTRLAHALGGTAQSMLKNELRLLAARFGTKDAKGWSIIEITITQLADQCGLARETVSRELRKLTETGLTEHIKGSIRVSPDL